jgi:uncharacterized YigZ family protein
METKDTYLSISAESRGTYREKASRFIAFAMPAGTEEEVKSRLDALRREYHDANHHCYAYRLGASGETYRVNDDGEPSGSAGRPIHGQIVSKGLSDVLVVVIRYFGGTKLGIPGLINAYRTAAGEALEKAVKIDKVLSDTMEVTFDYPKMNDVMRVLKESGSSIIRQEAEQTCRVLFSVRRSRSQEIRNRLAQRNIIFTSVNV